VFENEQPGGLERLTPAQSAELSADLAKAEAVLD
jgi:hypothetical protein